MLCDKCTVHRHTFLMEYIKGVTLNDKFYLLNLPIQVFCLKKKKI